MGLNVASAPIVNVLKVLFCVTLQMPDVTVKGPVNVLEAEDSLICDVALFWITPVTLFVMTEVIATTPVPAFKLVSVPVKLTEPVTSVMVYVLLPLSTILFVPVIPPLNMQEVAEGIIVIVPVALAILASTIGLAKVMPAPLSVTAEALATESPSVIVPVPEPPPADVLVVSETVPALIVNPEVKVLTPDSVNCDVELFWITPVTLVPMTALIMVPAALVLAFVIVPIISI